MTVGRVLVVDDDPVARETIGSALISAGYDVVYADSGTVALQKLRSAKDFGFVISDFNMPDINGLRTAEELRKIEGYESIPVVIMSAHSDSFLKKKSKEQGITGWVLKPVDSASLVSFVDRVMKGK